MADDSDPYDGDYYYDGAYDYYQANATNISSASTNKTKFDNNGTNGYHGYGDDYYYYDDYFYDEEYEDYFHVTFDYEIVLNGYIWPCLVLITTMANILVIWFFLLHRNRTKATNVLFISLAVSDSMTGLVTLPGFIYLYTLGNDFMTEAWCHIIMISRLYIARVFHTVSVWQTVCLGIQRYLCVCFPFASKRWCTVKKTLFSIAVMYGLATLLHIYHAFDVKTHALQCTWRIEKPCKETCVYLWFVVFTVHLLPCTVLIALTTRTVWVLHHSRVRMRALGNAGNDRRSARDRKVTITVVIVVIVFLVPEVPNGLYFLSVVIREHVHHKSTSAYLASHIVHSVYEVLLVVTFHCNFWIYCIMMHEFRQALRHTFTFPNAKRRFSQLRRTLSRTSSASGGSARTTMTDALSRHPTFSFTTEHAHYQHSNGTMAANSASIEPDQNGSIELCEMSLLHGKSHGDVNDDVFVN